MNVSVSLVIWCKQQDHYLIEEIQQAIGKLNIKKILYFQDIITFEQNDPIIYLSTAMDRSIQSYDKQLYSKMAKKSMQNKFFMMQIKNKNASYYQSLFKEVAKINLSMNFYLNLSINAQIKLCFKTKSEREQCKKYFQVFKQQILKETQSQQKQKRNIISQQLAKKSDQTYHFKIQQYQQQKQMFRNKLYMISTELQDKIKQIQELKNTIKELADKITYLENEQNTMKQLFPAIDQKQVKKLVNEKQTQTQQIYSNKQKIKPTFNDNLTNQQPLQKYKYPQLPLQNNCRSRQQANKFQNLQSKFLQKINQLQSKISNIKDKISLDLKTIIQIGQNLRYPSRKIYSYLYPYPTNQDTIKQLSITLMKSQINIEHIMHQILLFIRDQTETNKLNQQQKRINMNLFKSYPPSAKKFSYFLKKFLFLQRRIDNYYMTINLF